MTSPVGVTMSGAEFRAFYNDGAVWPEGAYHDDAIVRVDGKVFIGDEAKNGGDASSLSPACVVHIDQGWIFNPQSGETEDLCDVASKWLTAQKNDHFVVSLPKGQREALAALVATLGGVLVDE